MTGLSNRLKWVNRVQCLRVSRSASSLKLFDVKINVLRFGTEVARVDWMLFMRLRAKSRVCNLGERGKLERALISLSVKSMASWS